MNQMLTQIAPTHVKATSTDPKFADRPECTAYDVVSIWVKNDIDEATGEISSSAFTSMVHPVGQVGYQLNRAVDRLRASFAKRENKGYNDLEGYELFVVALEPSAVNPLA